MLEVFEEQFKNSIRYGMSYHQFWCDDPQLYYIYEEVYIDELKTKDILNWQAGVYIRYAVGSCLSAKCKYPEAPLFYGRKEEKPQNVYDMKDQFMAMVEMINKNFE